MTGARIRFSHLGCLAALSATCFAATPTSVGDNPTRTAAIADIERQAALLASDDDQRQLRVLIDLRLSSDNGALREDESFASIERLRAVLSADKMLRETHESAEKAIKETLRVVAHDHLNVSLHSLRAQIAARFLMIQEAWREGRLLSVIPANREQSKQRDEALAAIAELGLDTWSWTEARAAARKHISLLAFEQAIAQGIPQGDDYGELAAEHLSAIVQRRADMGDFQGAEQLLREMGKWHNSKDKAAAHLASRMADGGDLEGALRICPGDFSIGSEPDLKLAMRWLWRLDEQGQTDQVKSALSGEILQRAASGACNQYYSLYSLIRAPHPSILFARLKVKYGDTAGALQLAGR